MFVLFSTQGSVMPPATLLDKWPRTLPQPSRKNSMIRSVTCRNTHQNIIILFFFFKGWAATQGSRSILMDFCRIQPCRHLGKMYNPPPTPTPTTFQVISTLLKTMKDQSNPRVQAHAAAALINFTEDCPKSLLVPHLDSLVEHLHIIMEAKLQEVRCI